MNIFCCLCLRRPRPSLSSVADGQEEAFKVAAALVLQGVLQRHVILLQVHVFDGLQVILLTTRRKKKMYLLLLNPFVREVNILYEMLEVGCRGKQQVVLTLRAGGIKQEEMLKECQSNF